MNNYKPYQLININDHSVLVIGVDYSRFEDFAKDVKSELKQIEFCGLVIIDMLLSNGNNSNRFFQLDFNDFEYDTKTLVCIDANPDILNFSSKFFHDHIDLLENGILSQNEIMKIKADLAYL